MQLHQINQLAYPSDIEQTWRNALQLGDSVLLLEEAVLRSTAQHGILEALIEAKQLSLFYLQSDALAYGVTPTLGTALSDEEWVTITLSADANISW